MFGFVVGALCLIGLIVMIKRSRWHRGYAGCHGGRDHGHRGGGFWLRGIFQRLDTTPGQEKVIREEFEKLKDKFSDMRGEWNATGNDVGRAMRSESFDETILGDLFARHDDKLRELRKEMVGALARIHDALDERQRARLAEMLERGPGFRSWGGPYRSAW
jgi:Spy/CpxP family protein refolding chaperone